MNAPAAAVVLRPPEARDRSRVRRMVIDTGKFRPDEVDVAVEVFDGATSEPGVDYHALGAYDEDRLVGFAFFGPVPCTVATWDLYWIVVDPAEQRRGTGRRLLEATESAVREAGGRLIVVETSSRTDYAATRGFYEAVNYARTAEIADYYAPGDSLVVYTKYLDPPITETAHHG